MSTHRFILPLAGASAFALVSATAFAGPPPPPPSEGVGGSPPTSAGVRSAPPPPPSGGSSQRPQDPLVDQRTPTKDLSKTWGYSGSGEQVRPNYVRPAEERGVDIQINPIGYYQGVTLEGENLPPFAPEQLGGPAVLTWTGFEGEKGSTGSHVFLQLSAPVEHHLVQQEQMVTLRLPSTSVNVKNNMRRLDTSYFRTPVTSVDISRDGADTVVKIGLRRASTPNVFMREGANGYKILVVEFSVVSELSGSPAPPPPPPSSDDASPQS